MADGARRSGATGVDERMSVDKGSFHSRPWRPSRDASRHRSMSEPTRGTVPSPRFSITLWSDSFARFRMVLRWRCLTRRSPARHTASPSAVLAHAHGPRSDRRPPAEARQAPRGVSARRDLDAARIAAAAAGDERGLDESAALKGGKRPRRGEGMAVERCSPGATSRPDSATPTARSTASTSPSTRRSTAPSSSSSPPRVSSPSARTS